MADFHINISYVPKASRRACASLRQDGLLLASLIQQQDASGCSETVTTNSIVRKLGSDGASRWAHFSVNGFVIVSLTQKADEAMLTMASPAAAWTSSYSFGDNQIAHAELQAEALRQAIELAREWAVDAGRPYKEVLR
jgi:hypothetical protein